MTDPHAPLLATRGLGKRFDGVQALSGVDIAVERGEIHAICGENGAGKSTLIKILGGIHPVGSYDGEVVLDGVPAAFRSTADAQRAGIAVIHQELAMVGELTVAENIALGALPTRGGLVDWHRMHAEARQLLQRFHVSIDPERRVGSLGMGQQQLVEIVRAMAREPRLLILDEPTAALTTRETVRLLQMLRLLGERGIALIFVSHKLEEVFGISDRITVLRDGATVASRATSATSRDEVIRHMVGRALGQAVARIPAPVGEVLLDVQGLDVDPPGDDGIRLRGISFQARAGEVLGIGGLMGAGRSELLLHLMGAWGRRLRGRVLLGGQDLDGHAPRDAIDRGLTLVSEDRKRLGLVLGRSVRFNTVLSVLARMTRFGLMDQGAETSATQRWIEELRIKVADVEGAVSGLSGGNQQKVVIAKALMPGPRVVLLDEPTRGIDVGAKQEVYGIVNRLSAEGKAVVLVSSEMPELLGVADRILMLGGGRPGGEFTRAEATQERLLAAALAAMSASSQSGTSTLGAGR
jgi:D-xylose transport system ATP-binding protein